MPLRETYDKTAYTPVNARITEVMYGPHEFSLRLRSSDRDWQVNNIVPHGPGDPLYDLMVLLGVEDFSEIGGSLVRSLHFNAAPLDGESIQTQGLANIIEDRAMIFSDYEHHGVLVKRPDGDDDIPDEDPPETWPPAAVGGWEAIYNIASLDARKAGADSVAAHKTACLVVYMKGVAFNWPPPEINGGVSGALYNHEYGIATAAGNLPQQAHQLACKKLNTRSNGFPPDPPDGSFLIGVNAYNEEFRQCSAKGDDRSTAHVRACAAAATAVAASAAPGDSVRFGLVERQILGAIIGTKEIDGLLAHAAQEVQFGTLSAEEKAAFKTKLHGLEKAASGQSSNGDAKDGS